MTEDKTMLKLLKSIFGTDHFFFDLYEAERSPDRKAMTDLFDQYSRA